MTYKPSKLGQSDLVVLKSEFISRSVHTVIYATLVNTQTHQRTHRQLLIGSTISSASWAENQKCCRSDITYHSKPTIILSSIIQYATASLTESWPSVRRMHRWADWVGTIHCHLTEQQLQVLRRLELHRTDKQMWVLYTIKQILKILFIILWQTQHQVTDNWNYHQMSSKCLITLWPNGSCDERVK